MWSATEKRVGVILLLLPVAALGGLFLYLYYRGQPPKQGKLIDNFHAHRAAYESLRDMLESDDGLLRVASWGVETTKSGISIPPEGHFPVDRYHQYLGLLKEAGGIGAFRGPGAHPETLGIDVWAWGWAGDTRHVWICWLGHEPTNQIASLEAYYQTPKPRRPAFRHLDGNWYLGADW
jgi:hypothetical protein